MKKHVNLAHANTPFKKKVLQRIIADKVCPFCEEHFLKYHTKPIIKKGKYWILTENFDPYEGTKHHLLAVSRIHTQAFDAMPQAAWPELFRLFDTELKRRKISGGTMFMRFGDTNYTGGTVEHLHAQLLSGGKRPGKKPIHAKIGYYA